MPLRRVSGALVALGLGLPACAAFDPLGAGGWHEVRSGELVLLTSGEVEPVERLAQRLQWLEPIAEEVSGLGPGAPRPLTLVLFESRAAYLRHAPLPESSGSHARTDSGSLALVDGSGPWRTTVRIALHEYVHYFLACHGDFPTWYEEGLADYLAFLNVSDGSIELGLEDPLRVNLLRGRASMPLPALISGDTASPQYGDAKLLGRFHDTAWSLFHYLRLGRPQGREGLARYLASFQAGVPSPAALEEALGVSLPALQQELAAYVARSPLPSERLEARRFLIARPPVASRRLDPADVSALRFELEQLRPTSKSPSFYHSDREAAAAFHTLRRHARSP